MSGLVECRLAVAPDALFERAPKLGAMGLAHEVAALVVEGRVEEEALVLDLEVTVRSRGCRPCEGLRAVRPRRARGRLRPIL